MRQFSHPYVALCGWKGVDANQRLHAATFPRLGLVAPRMMAVPVGGAPVLLYPAYRQALGRDPGYPAQQIGDCVSFGHAHANDLLQCIEINLGGNLAYRETDTEFIYGASRQLAGMLGTSDGSYGSAAVKAMTTIGVVTREMLGANGAYSGARAKEWGDMGPPAELEAAASLFKLGNAAGVTTWFELVAAITNGYPVTICCNQGFDLIRDAEGFCAQRGTWGHCMVIAGVRFDRPGACVLQSWGPGVPSGPTALDQPDWSFWVDQPVVEAILAEGDSWALSKAPTFVSRKFE
jgi:hypothetical protein